LLKRDAAAAVALSLLWSLAWAPNSRGDYSVSERLVQFGPAVAARLRDSVAAAGLRYPPKELAYVAFKDARRIEVYGRNTPGEHWRYIKEYPVLAASGTLGPKLREGDNQVPEGVYRVSYLNPNSRFHLSLRLNYPNEFDRAMARADRRTRLGGDIMIHGNAVSIGCLAMGDEAAEDLFVLTALAANQNVRVVISPTDFRSSTARVPRQPAWIATLYAELRTELKQYER
jgi:murein L,D-transpeptidase YafK